MHTKPSHRVLSFSLAAIAMSAGLLFGARPAAAVTAEQVIQAKQKGDRVYDFARVLSRADEQRLQDQLEAMEQEGVAQGVVVIADRLEGATVDEFTFRIGEGFRAGSSGIDNGFVIAVSVADRKWRLEAGPGIQGMLPDSVANRLMRDELVPEFQAKRYAEGLSKAVSAVDARLEWAGGVEALPDREPEQGPAGGLVLLTVLLGGLTALTALRAWPRGATPGHDPWRLPSIGLGAGAVGSAVLAASQAPSGGPHLIMVGVVPAVWSALRLFEGAWTPIDLNAANRVGEKVTRAYWITLVIVTCVWIFTVASAFIFPFLLLAVPLGFAIRGYFARLPRKCPECVGVLRWLPEAEEPQFLKDVEDLEQRLGSVDYDIWRCCQCSRSAVFAHNKVFAPYKECPRCHRRTLSTRTVMDEKPTAWQDGWASDVTECKNPKCNHREVTKQHRVQGGGYRDDGFGGIIIIPPIIGGWGGHGGHSGGSTGGDFGGGGFDVGDFGGGGFDGGGASGDW